VQSVDEDVPDTMDAAEPPGVRIDGLNSGWVHTHGMDALGLADLEIRHVPRMMAPAAGNLLIQVAQYMARKDPIVKPYDTMDIGSPRLPAVFGFVPAIPIQGHEDHYQGDRWVLADIMGGLCACCGAPPPNSPSRRKIGQA
jgi:hypothetical protein